MDLLQRQAEQAEERQDFETAFHLWRQLVRREPEPSFLLRLGSAAQKVERWDEAEEAFSEALALDPTSSLIMENLGILWANRSDKKGPHALQVAEGWFLRALKNERTAPALTLLGTVYLRLRNDKAARKALEEAISIDPEYEEALYNLGILEEAINPQRSVELLEKAISIDPDYAIAHQALGRYYHRVGDLPRAEYHLRRSLEIDPEDYFSHLYLANNLAVQGRDEEAEHVYRAALKLPAATGRGYGFFADFLDGLGRHEEAQQIRARMPPAT